MPKMNRSAPAGGNPAAGAASSASSAFDKALKGFVASISKSMTFARECAEMAIRHFQEHGDVTYLQRFRDAMPENYSRRAAFDLWMRDHSPITMKDKRLVKDNSETAKPFNIDGACAKPFWDYAPEREQVAFGADDVVISIERVLHRFENTKKYKPADDAAQARLDLAKAAIANLKTAAAA